MRNNKQKINITTGGKYKKGDENSKNDFIIKIYIFKKM